MCVSDNNSTTILNFAGTNLSFGDWINKFTNAFFTINGQTIVSECISEFVYELCCGIMTSLQTEPRFEEEGCRRN